MDAMTVIATSMLVGLLAGLIAYRMTPADPSTSIKDLWHGDAEEQQTK